VSAELIIIIMILACLVFLAWWYYQRRVPWWIYRIFYWPSNWLYDRRRRSEERRAQETKGIFISYRRDETAGYAGRIADRFTEHFGEDRIFRDLDSLEPGLDFAEVIQSTVDSTEVMIAVIGKNWLTATDEDGQKRLENPNDYVRIEIATALERDTRVIPLLVQGAAMPRAEDLPEDLASLTRRNAFELHDFSWNEEVQRLITTLDKVLKRRPV
jgi:hypothetical protein